ncbi:helix-turn-helix domain-containing transcriptional regulator [Klebsiella michiganensis]|uniref:helix-turn-helix domain-containing transcriptional regulator n=1 Tax=Klebsiella michiganensis TaxID=1134687 RepID=UPI001C98F1DB|nr:addiction module antitoxin [Klebsiella michiganensis]QZG74297.1 addiction module antitoxin [Klebsiella michiganensis]
MNKIIDVDVIGKFELKLTYENGTVCEVDLYKYNDQPPFTDPKKFVKFGLLPNGNLEWIPNVTISSEALLQRGSNITHDESIKKTNFANIISMALYDAIIENRPEIIQAALRTAVDKYGTTKIAKNSGTKSRTSIYKSLDENTYVSMSTVVNLAHAVLDLEEKESILR